MAPRGFRMGSDENPRRRRRSLVRDALRRALTLAGYEVQMAEGGQQALTQAPPPCPMPSCSTSGMPDVDGLEVCRSCAARATACRS